MRVESQLNLRVPPWYMPALFKVHQPYDDPQTTHRSVVSKSPEFRAFVPTYSGILSPLTGPLGCGKRVFPPVCPALENCIAERAGAAI